MIDPMDIFFVASIAFVIWRIIRLIISKDNKLGIDGKLIWTDHGRNTKPFFNSQFAVFGKPDLLHKIKGGVLATEYKSRKGQIYDSDIVQAKTAALACRGDGHKVIKVLVKTATTERYFPLPKLDNELYKEVAPYIEQARDAKIGKPMMCRPEPRKCRSCSYTNSCVHGEMA